MQVHILWIMTRLAGIIWLIIIIYYVREILYKFYSYIAVELA